jgi:Ca2+/Na+ antiporter
VAQAQRIIRSCIPFDEFGEEISPAKFEKQCSQGIMDILELHEELDQPLYITEEEAFDTERLELLRTVKASQKEIHALLRTAEAKVLYAIGLASLVAGIIAFALGNTSVGLAAGIPFVIIAVILLPIFYGVHRTRLNKWGRADRKEKAIM